VGKILDVTEYRNVVERKRNTAQSLERIAGSLCLLEGEPEQRASDELEAISGGHERIASCSVQTASKIDRGRSALAAVRAAGVPGLK
jgi:hypothetical protein